MSDYITKGITSTVVKGFKLENGSPVPCEIEFEGALTTERATAKTKGVLVASVEQKRTYYRLSRDVAMQHVTNERADKSDIQLGETGTTVYALRLVQVGKSDTEFCEFHFDAPMTESRAFGAARRAASKKGFDILPYATMQERASYFLPRATFFELAEPCEAPSAENEEIAE